MDEFWHLREGACERGRCGRYQWRLQNRLKTLLQSWFLWNEVASFESVNDENANRITCKFPSPCVSNGWVISISNESFPFFAHLLSAPLVDACLSRHSWLLIQHLLTFFPPFASHIFCHFFYIFLTHVENQITRSYTPVPRKYASSNISDDSVVDLLFIIKTYENGALSSRLKASEELIQLSLKPKGALNLYRIRNCTKFAMLAAGSGITPMYSVLDHLLERRENRVWVLF